MNVQYSRGCPFDCEFCDIGFLYGRRLRTKTEGQIIAELEALYARGWRGPVFLADDNFIGNKRRLKNDILPAIVDWAKARDFPFKFTTQASVDLADHEDLMRLMIQAGFRNVFVGIETPNDESLAECNKHANRNRDLVASVRKMQDLGLLVQGGFIVGFDSDPPSIFERQIQFIQDSGIIIAMVGLLNAIRGTRLYERLKKERRLLKRCSGDNTDCSTNFIPRMNHRTLVDGYKRILRTIYSPERYYERVATFLRNHKPMPGLQRFRFEYLVAFLKSIVILGMIEKGRTYYWKLLLATLFRRPRLLPRAIVLSIYGFHFRKVLDAR
jgi:radical SAM superfamily enzyme YgiQ (UPF0313 family)